MNTNYFELENSIDDTNRDSYVEKYEKYVSSLKEVREFENNFYDADISSEKLYKDLSFILNMGTVIKTRSGWGIELYTDLILGSDYIGPSRQQAFNLDVEAKKILEMYSQARVLGGHVL